METKTQLPPPRKPKRVLTLREGSAVIKSVQLWAKDARHTPVQATVSMTLVSLWWSLRHHVEWQLNEHLNYPPCQPKSATDALEWLRDAEHAIREAKLAEPQNLKLARGSLFYAAEKLLEEIALVVDSGR